MRRSVRPLALLFVGALASSCSALTSFNGLAGQESDAAAADAGGDGTVPGNVDAPASGGSAYSAAVLADAPIAYFRFDEASGPTAKSIVGAATGSYEGSFSFGAAGATSDGNPSVTFDGTSTRLDLGDAFRFGGTVSYSLEIWIKPNVNGDTRFIIDRAASGSPAQGYSLYMGKTYLTYSRTVNGMEVAYAGTTPPPLDVWTHVVVTYDGMVDLLYVNGVQVSNKQGATMPIGDVAGSFVLGDNSPGQFNKFSGQMDELAVYDKPLSAARIQAHFIAAK